MNRENKQMVLFDIFSFWHSPQSIYRGGRVNPSAGPHAKDSFLQLTSIDFHVVVDLELTTNY